MDKVSVITTYYNANKYVLFAVVSVLNQKFDTDKISVEYIIVDDCTEDNSHQVIDDYLNVGKYNRSIDIVHLKTEINMGCGGARNFGISKSTGNYLMFLDADDYYLSKTFIQRAYDEAIASDADIVEFGVVVNYPNGMSKQNVVKRKELISGGIDAEIALFKDNKVKFNVWSKIIKKDLANTFEYSKSRTYEDVYTIPVWLWNAKKISIMPSIEVNYRCTTNSIIRSDKLATRLGTVSAIASHCERFKGYKSILKAMYNRALIDISFVLDGHTSNDDGFTEMAKLNELMLSYIYKRQI